MKTKDYESPDWLTRLLNSNGRAELGLKILHSVVFDRGKDADFKNLKLNINNSLRFNPRPREVGISSGVEPDFLIEEYKVVGDIKSGTKFEDYFPLTCAGYALAYENEKGKGHDIDWGIIYFIPTRYPTDYVKPLTCAQVYIFPVDDNLRRWFIDVRDQDYSTISKDTPPNHPEVDKRHHCPYCTFKETCEPKA
jgi:CRISPR/Cas system-associated exonuclease Cas4 (RecB family)